jgi:hypothetical protein
MKKQEKFDFSNIEWKIEWQNKPKKGPLKKLKITVQTRWEQWELAKKISGNNLEKINFLARIDYLSNKINNTNIEDFLKLSKESLNLS